MSRVITCFLVDDDKDDQEIFQIALSRLNISIKCITADDGYIAMQMLEDKNFVPDYIFLDLNMPRVDGKQCLTQIKSTPRLKDVPVIIYTTSSRQYHKDEAFKLGANHFITKPPDVAVLTELLTALLAYPIAKK